MIYLYLIVKKYLKYIHDLVRKRLALGSSWELVTEVKVSTWGSYFFIYAKTT